MIGKAYSRIVTIMTSLVRIISGLVTHLELFSKDFEALVKKKIEQKNDRDRQFQTGIIFVSEPWARMKFDEINRGYDYEREEFKGMVKSIWDYTMVSYDGMMSLLTMAKYCENNKIEGSFVEVGCWKGGCAALMAMSSMQCGNGDRDIHVFDSFEGMPSPVEQDMDHSLDTVLGGKKVKADGKLEPINWLDDASVDDVKNVVLNIAGYREGLLKIHKGWFQETIPDAAKSIDKISILRLDGDFYESYKIPLEHLYDKVVPGGFIIIDDWYFKGCREAVTEFMEDRGIKQMLCHADITTRYFQKLT